ncbi:MAG: cation transporter [Flavobacteriaceae bacterium]|nr:cation transporter [Flavobacteriaceae bacterium]
MKRLLVVTLVFFTMTAMYGQNKNARAVIEVDGVCGMCKERIEKAAIRTKGVKSAVWSIETHDLSLIYDERKTNLRTIQGNIAAVGHDTKAIKATEEAYLSVHECCRYRDLAVQEDHKNGN